MIIHANVGHKFKKTMKRSIYSVTIIILIISCSQKHGRDNHNQNDSLVTSINTPIDNTYKLSPGIIESRVDSFVRSLIGTNAILWTFKSGDKNLPKYLHSFKQEGIKQIQAYSNKNYPKKVSPTDYEHFILFMVEYQNKKMAQEAFERFNSDIDSFEIVNEKNVDSDYDRKMYIYGNSKSGGLIAKKDNFLFSLVETCRDPYKFGTWPEYEKYFIECIFDKTDNGQTYFNADCGKMKFTKQIINK
jgi:hypothetical protein